MNNILKKLSISLLVVMMTFCAFTIAPEGSMCQIEIAEAASAIKLSTTSKTLYMGQTFNLKLTRSDNKKLSSVTWTSSNSNIVSVSKITTSTYASTATIQGVKPGTCYISTKVGGTTYKCTITVSSPYLDYSSKVKVGSTATISLFNAQYMESKYIAWSISSSNATLSLSSSRVAKVKFKKKGTYTIKVVVGGAKNSKTLTAKITAY